MIKKSLILLVIALSLITCKVVKQYRYSNYNTNIIQNQENLILNDWFLKDINDDTIPGISIEKIKSNFLKTKKGNEIIVAIIDAQFDISHKGLKNYIWINTDEISNNKIDDDGNGFIDDIQGWNFIGNQNYENILYANMEEVRIVRCYNNLIKNSTSQDTLKILGEENYHIYINAYKTLQKERKISASVLKQSSNIIYKYRLAFNKIKPFIAQDSLFTINFLKDLKSKKTDIKKEIDFLILTKKAGIDNLESIENDIKYHENRLNKYYNLDYNERDPIDKFPSDINYTNYGNNNVSNFSKKLYHGTRVAGVICKIIPENCKIMPISISANGDEHDKDIALAIRYAVDNGAKVINMSFGKDFSLYKEWVYDALDYAQRNNVLIVTSAGNDSKDLDSYEINNYPNDSKSGTEFVSNFIKVGGSTINIDENLIYSYSNFGKEEVDVFAPSKNIYTASVNGKYEYRSGTSYASPIVSGIATLLFSYYPDLTASQVKHIIMDSGVEYTFPVKVPITGTKKDTLIPFNKLSKSGRIVNAYNALIMADSISKTN